MIRDLLSELTQTQPVQDSRSMEDRLLSLLQQNDKHSARSLSLEMGISERQVQRILKMLKGAGVIAREGANRSGKWIVL